MGQRKGDTLKSSETNTNIPHPCKNQITLKSVKILSFLLEKKQTNKIKPQYSEVRKVLRNMRNQRATAQS